MAKRMLGRVWPLKSLVSEEVSVRLEDSDPRRNNHVFSHSEIVRKNCNTDVSI